MSRCKTVLEVMVEKGMLDGQKIVLDHEGDQASGVESGDVVVVLHEQKHDLFQRSCSDLILVVKVWSLFFFLQNGIFRIQDPLLPKL